MTSRCQAIVTTILKCGKKHGKRYSFPRQAKIMELVNAYHGFDVSERTVRRDIAWLKENNFLEVIRRTRDVGSGKRVWTSNLYKLKQKVFMWLRSMEVLTKDLFSFFHRPKLASNQLTQKQASSIQPPTSVGMLLIKERNGTVKGYDPRTGAIAPVK